MSEKMGSLIMDLQGKELSSEDKELLLHPLIAGVILFARNYDSQEQIAHLCHDIHTLRPTLLIMVDQEGGRVQRFIPGFTRLPSMATFGTLYDDDPILALTITKECGWLMAAELCVLGIDISLAPVLDINIGINQAIGDRAFHESPEIVAL